MAKVYVSSTVADLGVERQAVMDWLVAAGHQPVHSYRADSETVRDSCLDDVSACDLYLLILGHRYGFQPRDNNPEHLSITHLEYRRAGESGIPRIALLRTNVPDISTSDLLDPLKLAQVFAFREEVKRGIRAAEFDNHAGLLAQLSTGVHRALERSLIAEASQVPVKGLDRDSSVRATRPRPRQRGARVRSTAIRRIFISYRHDDSGPIVGRIYDRLAGDFGKENIFKDVDDIPFGVDFLEHLDREVQKCNVLFAVIGPRWLDQASGGGSRLEDPNDFVRVEIASALRRTIPVVPVLVDGAQMPSADQLPDEIKLLARRNGTYIRHDPDFHTDMARLLSRLG